MNFSVKTKYEIIKREFEKRCCKISALSGFLRTSGSVEAKNGMIGFSVLSDLKILKYFSKIVSSVYGIEPKIEIDGEKENRGLMTVLTKTSFQILVDTAIIKRDEALGGWTVELSIVDELFKDDNCRIAFIIGAFLGSGTVTVPTMDNSTSTSYHMEFVFTQDVTAEDFSSLIAGFGFMTKLIDRKEYSVVYLKNAESINDALTLLGAKNASLELTDIIIRKDIKNRVNRSLNCEMSNMTKSVDADVADKEAIKIIEQTIGISSLPLPLQAVCVARKNSEVKSLSKLAEELNISKSCLSHRLRKLKEIASTLGE